MSTVVQSDSNLVSYDQFGALFASNWHRARGQSSNRNLSADSSQCTWRALELWRNYQGYWPLRAGNAGWWNDNAPGYGWGVQGQPTVHAVVVFEPNVLQSGSVGHVGWVDSLRRDNDGSIDIHILERNFDGRGSDNQRWVRHQSGMSYIPAFSL